MYPGISLAITTLFSLICLIPHRFNLAGIRVTLENAPRIYSSARAFLRWIGLVVNVLFFFICFMTVHAAESGEMGTMAVLAIVIVPLFVILISLCVFVMKLNKLENRRN
mmetsp:Transcript_7456/g.6787  ORF Transcript_7456/g.6787 Transcript_7456/m.6787 type:complete len:109 (+) Transcript_7456:278-604(+)